MANTTTISNNPTNSKFRIKKKQFYDEYILTNKHIICKFKYLVLCFDRPDDLELSGGLINLTKSRLEELFCEQNVQLNSLSESGLFFNVLKQLKEWHPQISKIEIDCKNIYEIEGIMEYKKSWQQIKNHLSQLPNNNCINSDQDFEIFKKLNHKVIDIKVCFQLIRKIKKVEDYKVNFNYLHQLLLEHIMDWNLKNPSYLDEVSVNINQIPYASQRKYVSDDDDDICYVYPYMNLIPLHSIDN